MINNLVKTLKIIILEDYSRNTPSMISKISKIVKHHIYSILNSKAFDELNKPRKDFIVSILWLILSIKGKINFLQLGRYSS
jgi:hypothetical protein